MALHTTKRLLVLGLLMVTARTAGLPTTSMAAPSRQELVPNAPALLTWSPDGEMLAITSLNGVEIFSLQEPDTASARLAVSLAYSITSVAFSPDGTRIATLHDPDILEALDISAELSTALGWVWDSGQGDRLFELTGHELLFRLNTVAFSPDGTLVAYGGVADGLIHIKEAANDEDVVTINPVADLPEWEPGLVIPELMWIGFDPGGATMASSHRSGDIYLWDAATWDKLAVYHSTSMQSSLQYAAGGQSIVAQNTMGSPEIWDTRTGSSRLASEYDTIQVHAVGYDENWLAIAVAVEDPNSLRVYDLESGSERVITFEALTFADTFPDLQFGPVGNMVIYKTYDDGQGTTTTYILDLKAGSVSFSTTATGHRVTALSPTGTHLAVGTTGEVAIWDIVTGDRVGVIHLPDAPLPEFK